MLKNKGFIFLSLSSLFSSFGDATLFVVLLSMLQGLVVDGVSTSIYFIASTLPFVLFSLHIGAFVEKHTLQKVMIASDFFRIIILLLFFLISLLDIKSVNLIYILIFTIISLNIFFTTSSAILIPQMIKNEDIPKLNSVLRMINMISKLLAYSFVAFLFSLNYIAYNYLLVVVIFYISSLVMVACIRPYYKNSKIPSIRMPLSSSIKDGLNYIKGNRILTKLFIFFALGWMVGSSIDLYLISYLKEVLGKGANSMYVITTPTMIGMVIGAIISPVLYKNIPKKYGLVLSLIIFGFVILGFAFKLPFVILQVFLLLGGISQGILNIFVISYLQMNVKKNYLGRVFSVYNIIAMGGSIPGYLLFGILLDYLGVINLGFILSGYLLLIGIVCFINLPNLEKQERLNETA